MGVPKNARESQPIVTEHEVLRTNGIYTHVDVFRVGDKLSDLQSKCFAAISRCLGGFVIQGLSQEGALEKCDSEGVERYVLRIRLSFELAPYSQTAIRRCKEVFSPQPVLGKQLEIGSIGMDHPGE